MSLRFLFAVLLFGAATAAATEGILPGESDPNTSPRTDRLRAEANEGHQDVTLLDDRKKCASGKQRFQRMKCGAPGQTPECEHYQPVLDCLRKAPRLRCKKPKVLVPVYRCG